MPPPPPGTATCALDIPAEIDGIAEQLEGLEAFLTEQGVPHGDAAKLILALDELLVNTASYGEDGANGGRIAVRAEIADGAVRIDISDAGRPFDPTRHPDPDLEAALEDRKIGGLGIHLVRRFMDDFRYERRDGRNHIHLRKNFASA